MKKIVASQVIAMVVAFSGSTVYAGNVGVDLNIHLGDRYRAASVDEYVYQEPVLLPVTIEYPAVERARFVYPEQLGFYVAVGVPYDLCYIGDSYYLFRDGYWFKARSSRGPWAAQSYRDLPWELRRQRLERIRYYRHGRNEEPMRYTDRYSGRDSDCDHRGHHDDERDALVQGRPGLAARWR
ncbi:hypothetical protein [Geotalea sp. SG265]|uniref:hypothetical protein n=1 Tax=Geotalea sp. SG265 TaxID=2922867 RepID=UPI001FAEA2CC|nr:hypothetical protein [Geotalea sp. SG265]